MEQPAIPETPLPTASAPFLKTLKTPRGGAATAGTAPTSSASPASASPASSRESSARATEDPETLPELSSADESFESATTVVPRSVLAHRDVESTTDRTPISALKPPPALEEMVARIAPETKQALEEIFRARFRSVRRITPEQLR